ncbi:MAG: radical SAM protein [Thermodesulfobacteriota bacterium]
MDKPVSHQAAENHCASDRRASGRVHLPMAPKALARVRFSPDKPLPRALSPEQALNWLEYLAGQGESLKVVNINGPGDPLATPELTLQILGLLRDKYPGLSLCLTTLGFGAAKAAGALAELGLAHVSILLDAVEPEAVQRIYAWIRPGTRTLPLSEAARLLVQEQAAAISALAAAGVPVQAKTTVYPGINAEQVPEAARRAAELGAGEMKLFPFLATCVDCPRPTGETDLAQLERLAARAGRYLPTQLVDLATCQQMAERDLAAAAGPRAALPVPSSQRPHLAVCSSDGFQVDLHLGQADQYLIYGPRDGVVTLLETRPAPPPGAGDWRWQQAALALSDCFAVLAAAAGEAPKRLLAEKGLAVLAQEGNIEGLVDELYGGGKKKGGRR